MQPDNPLAHTKHIFRIFLLLILFVVALVLGRSAFIPKTWGQYGWYRGDNVAEQRAKPMRHGNDQSCKECHAEEFEEHGGNAHATVRCEVCHAPVVDHAVGKEKIADMPVNPTRHMCLLCHQKLKARPAKFPQINPREHVKTNGGDWGPEVCIECHEAHAPD